MWFGYWINCALFSSLLTYITERRTLLSTVGNIDNNLLDLSEVVLLKTLLFGSDSFETNANTNILNATIEYVLSTKKFEEPLFQWNREIFKQVYESENSVSIVIVSCLFLITCTFFLFLFSYDFLGTWWLSLLILQCMI